MKINENWVTVYPPTKKIGSDEMCWARVNWSAIGSVNPDDAIQFANAIIKAAKKAKRLNTKAGQTRSGRA